MEKKHASKTGIPRVMAEIAFNTNFMNFPLFYLWFEPVIGPQVTIADDNRDAMKNKIVCSTGPRTQEPRTTMM
ncbi:MAG: hypothetical protein MK138_17065, partial [Planctomycetes bacterium]|nr:hypothetical protein [Planctomycetota bacterium]